MKRLIHRAPGLFARRVALLCALLVLTGCAGHQAFREAKALAAAGRQQESLSKLEEATRLEPGNAEYRIALMTQRNLLVGQALRRADEARRAGDIGEAEKGYRQVLVLDPENAMATQGLAALYQERKHRQALAGIEALLGAGDAVALEQAAEKLRVVLAENPQQREALLLKERLAVAVRPADAADALAAKFKKPITLEFRDAPFKSVFDVISKVSGLNFFFDKEIRPDLKVTVLAKNTSIEDAVRLMLVTNQLEQKVLGPDAILIYPNTPQKAKDYQSLSVRSFFIANADVKAVANTLKTILKVKDMVLDERLGIVIVRDTPEVIRMAERLIALQDVADPEVMLEVEVLEVQRSRLMELGIRWPEQLTLAPLVSQGASLTLNDLLNLSRNRIAASVGNTTLNARKEDQDSNILANPRIRVRNKEKAKIMIGDRVPVFTTSQNGTSGFASESVSYLDVGLKLEVEPNIYLDEDVAIRINLEVSNIIREVIGSAKSIAYQIGTRNASTVLRLKDGETQVLAGLINDEDRSTGNRVPGLGEFPLLGRLFGSQKDDAKRSEIMLAITPRIIRSVRRPDLINTEFDSGTETAVGAKPLRLVPVPAEGKGEAPAKGTTAPATSTQVSPQPASAAPAAAPAAIGTAQAGGLGFSWAGPAAVRVGEQFSISLQVSSNGPLQGVPLLIGYDPATVQLVSVQEGDFLKQQGGETVFNQRSDPAQGKVFVSNVRRNAAGINGNGALASFTFKALKAGEARINLVSVSPEPAPAQPLPLPLTHTLKVGN
ncbi:cohesin domain-containing protein [Chitiniphilus purpureus]|uniref:Cohesin domain-containing protein n=1 Tax=Chitiniphilus purpureus TaxID=2981137 RepID=A0ABY6DLG7_9NEIS|nr:secretin N-terminal domain-containing protein [Chitiniphilus sp. CD1]UXY15215.1 cohesin domain-containing protein [Chitiniphilus sp. CD1]